MLQINKFYLPEHCIQGEEITAYILWEGDDFKKIEITNPKKWVFKEIFNIEKENYDKIKNNLIVIKTETPGYFAFTIKTTMYKDFKKNENINIKFNDNPKLSCSNKICLFRPEVKLYKCPKRINIRIKGDNKIYTNEKIIVENIGEGIAYINIEPLKDSEIELKEPPSLKEFIEKVWKDIDKKSKRLIKQFPEHTGPIKQFLKLKDLEPSFEEKRINEIKEVTKELNDVFVNDEDFLEKFIDMIFSSYLSNLNLITLTSIDIFMKYLTSLQENHIFFINSLDYIYVENKGIFKGEIQISDKGYNKYKSIPFQIELYANKAEIPLYTIFNWSHGSD